MSESNQRTEQEHVHSDECWEPDSGCDMGRNEKYARRATLSSNPVALALRDWACSVAGDTENGLLTRAADEIERLERELAFLGPLCTPMPDPTDDRAYHISGSEYREYLRLKRAADETKT